MIRTSRFGKDAKDGNFLRYMYEDCRTLYESFRRGAKESSTITLSILHTIAHPNIYNTLMKSNPFHL